MFFTHVLVVCYTESTCSICGYIAAYSNGGREGTLFRVPWWSHLLLYRAPIYSPALPFRIIEEKMRDAQNAPSGLHLDLMQLSILIVWLSSLYRHHSPHTLLVCLHTILVSITINFYRGKLTNMSLIIGFSRSKSYLKTSWPWLMESITARVGFFPFRRAKRDVNDKNNQNNVRHPRTCKVQHAF